MIHQNHEVSFHDAITINVHSHYCGDTVADCRNFDIAFFKGDLAGVAGASTFYHGRDGGLNGSCTVFLLAEGEEPGADPQHSFSFEDPLEAHRFLGEVEAALGMTL